MTTPKIQTHVPLGISESHESRHPQKKNRIELLPIITILNVFRFSFDIIYWSYAQNTRTRTVQ